MSADYLDTFSEFAAQVDFGALPETLRAHTGWVLALSLIHI